MKFLAKIRCVAITSALCATLCGGTPTALARADTEMTQEQAAQEYLATVCKSNRARTLFYQRVLRGQDSLSQAEVRRRLPQLRRAASLYSWPLANTARHLFNPPAPWPTTVSNLVTKLANMTVHDANVLVRASNARSAIQYMNLFRKHSATDSASNGVARKIRALLDLPPPGRGC